LTVLWSIINVLLLFFASVICVEPPKRRLDERFSTTEPTLVLLNAGTSIPCRLHDLSLGVACLTREDGWRNLVGPASFSLDQGRIVIPFDVVRRNGARLALKFHPDPATRSVLIVHPFTGAYHQYVESISVPQVFRALTKVIVPSAALCSGRLLVYADGGSEAGRGVGKKALRTLSPIAEKRTGHRNHKKC